MQQTMYIPTGNEKVSLPMIRQHDAAIMDATFLHMGYRGMIELRGGEAPFMQPVLAVDGCEVILDGMGWENISYWIPRFSMRGEGWLLNGTILTPIGERGFMIRLSVRNTSSEMHSYTIGLTGCWADSIHAINESKSIDANKVLYESNWNHSYVFDLRRDVTVFSIAPMTREEMDVKNARMLSDRIEYVFMKKIELGPGEEQSVDFAWGFGMEEVGASTAAKEMLRHGFDAELARTVNWLDARTKYAADPRINELMNKNFFFNFFFASGQTLDTEEFVLITSRSPRYYVSAAYWDRDSFLWSFPSILLTDPGYAKEMLEYAFTRQIRNIGIHSRYIDGTVLEPGFELDELCAPILALCRYVRETGDLDYLREPHVKKGIERAFTILADKKHSDIDLYETFLQPTDDPILYRYLTYDNVLVWSMCHEIGSLYGRIYGKDIGDEYMKLAEKVKEAILTHCVVKDKGERIYAWSVDLNGLWNIYDEPPGSLELLPWYGFCEPDDEVYINTVKRIRDPEYVYSFAGCPIAEIGCEHAPYPWILSLGNSILCGRKEHVQNILQKIVMDNGYACESVDEQDGTCRTGEAFATCAGFFAYGLYHLFGRQNDTGLERTHGR